MAALFPKVMRRLSSKKMSFRDLKSFAQFEKSSNMQLNSVRINSERETESPTFN